MKLKSARCRCRIRRPCGVQALLRDRLRRGDRPQESSTRGSNDSGSGAGKGGSETTSCASWPRCPRSSKTSCFLRPRAPLQVAKRPCSPWTQPLVPSNSRCDRRRARELARRSGALSQPDFSALRELLFGIPARAAIAASFRASISCGCGCGC